MNRRSWLAWLSSFLLVSTGLSLAQAQQPEEITLTDRLRAGLRCRRPEEVTFVETVVALVDQQKLSTDMVLSTYQWAIKQRPDFPFYYFKYGICRRAAALGVTIE